MPKQFIGEPTEAIAEAMDTRRMADLAERRAALAAEGTTSLTFFNNDIADHAVRNADTLNRHLGRLGVL